ncbi:glycoside hydrolase family 16 protein [Trematosphaeria pertusa]|uniref:endo-1,3(4)-beta-glucanase n=1 Tax=Trematosphaeria pertusa TaxID=390896 RepID=A0A6A6J190_9PLEO|nr:glycoside hydrolase family 16 protein [Trematosphaeria pertusa]KAF2256308.1 glycoside hydrolase family 16 protein [Trematosphaeria pertusa]
MHLTRARLAALLLALCIQVQSISAAYTLVDNCAGSSFASCFSFFSGGDPTHGFVRYLSQSDAQSQGLFSVSGNSVYMGVDSKNKAPNGRASIRLESKKLYNRGLFVLDVAHMPSSTCGTWPSFWTWGAEKPWPENGEIGIHTNTVNAMSLHTSDGCSIDANGMLGRVVTTNCFISAPGQTSNAGCGIESSSASSFGTPFNGGGGGVYAMEWTTSSIKIWFFPRNSIPADLAAGNAPDPSKWSTPQASFQGGCDIGRHFVNHQIVIDTTFCGDWAGAVWPADCKALAGSCNEYVANNPGVFAESYWRINYLKVFRQ